MSRTSEQKPSLGDHQGWRRFEVESLRWLELPLEYARARVVVEEE